MGGWIRIRSWHLILTPTRVPSRYVTLCERRAEGHTAQTFPQGEKTCETCLRKAQRLRDLEVDV